MKKNWNLDDMPQQTGKIVLMLLALIAFRLAPVFYGVYPAKGVSGD